VKKALKPDGWYTARDTVLLVDGQVTEATIKDYCKAKKLKCKKVGPRKQWMIAGSAIKKLRKDWKIE
jgi:hypothetical protein